MDYRLTSIKKLLMSVASILMILALTSCTGASSGLTPVSGDTLNIPPEITQFANNWPLPNVDYANTRATTHSTINSGNVNTLGIAWAVPLPGQGIFGSASTAPIIMGNTAYFQDLGNNIFAVDLRTGAIKWKMLFNSSNIGPNGIAVGYGKVFGSSDPYNIVALDMNTGAQVWKTQVTNQPTVGVDIQPTVYNNMVYISTVPGSSGGNFYSGGQVGTIMALDQSTGKIAWTFDTVDTPDIWGNKVVNSGGGSWYNPAIDTNTGITYWGIGNPAPFPGTVQFPNGSSRPGPNLYTNSIVALDSRNGTLMWYNQVKQHDLFDADFQIPPILASVTISGTQEDLVIGAGKLGKVVAINRVSGKTVWTTDVGKHQNDDLTSIPDAGNVTTRVYPGFFGGVETPMAYSQGIVYVPVVNLYADYTPSSAVPQPFGEATGELVAIEAETGAILWDHPLKSPCFGGATVVNDIVFTSTFDGMMYAFNTQTGEQVWSWQAPGPVNAWPSASGDTILVPVGLSSPFPAMLAFRLGAAGPGVAMLPLDGQTFESGNITVSAMPLNFKLVQKLGDINVQGEGHLHYFLDVAAPTTQGQPAVPSTGVYTATANTSFTFTDVQPGMHTVSVELVNNDHTPLSTPVVATANIVVTAPGPKVTITQPQAMTALPAGDVTVTVQVSNFDLASSNASSGNSSGQGKIIYYMDTVISATPGQPVTAGTYFVSSDTSYTWKNVSAGTHTFSVQLVNANNTPLSPPVTASVVVSVGTGTTGGGP